MIGVLGLVSALVADRLRLRRNGLVPGSLVVYEGREGVIQPPSWTRSRIALTDGGILLVSHDALARRARLLARRGDPIPVEIRLAVDSRSDVELARRIVFRTVARPSQMASSGKINVETSEITDTRVVFVVRAFARDLSVRDELLSELRGSIYHGLRTAGIRASTT